MAAGAAVAIGIGGCGGDDGGGGDDQTVGADEGAAKTKTASLDAVLGCLKKAGVSGSDQSNSMGEKIGIDGAGGRAIIYFESSAAEAKSTAGVAKATGETAVVKRSVVITLPGGTDIDQATVEGCVEAPG